MKQGTLISGAAHGALVAAAIFGLPWLSPRESEPISVTSVSFVSEAAFEAAQQAASAPAAEDAASDAVVLPPEVAAEPELPVVTPQSRPPAEPEEIPETAVLRPDFGAGAPLAGPRGDLAAVTPELLAPQDPGRVTQPRPRPVPRVEALAQPEAPDDVQEARDLLPEISPSAEADLPAPLEEATAPPEAAPEPITEAAPVAPEALVNVAPPRSRPDRLAQTAAVAPRETDTVPEPVTPPEPPREETPPPQNLQSQLEALVASANNATAPTPPSQTQPTQPSAGQGTAQSGPPLTSGEREGMRLAVQRCWNLPAGLRDAGELKVTLAAELTVTGTVIDGSIRLIDPVPAPDARYQGAFEAGRRALLRCSPYTDLPADKYAQWRRLEIVFNPEGMVSW